LTIWHCILSAELTKPHFSRLFFSILPTGHFFTLSLSGTLEGPGKFVPLNDLSLNGPS